MNICFIMYPWEKVEPETDTTLRIIHEAYIRGHRVGICNPSNLTIRNSVPSSFCKFLDPHEKPIMNIPVFHKKATFKEKLTPLGAFDVIFMRANPPIDTIMLNFLDSIKEDCFIVNSIDGIRKAYNKLYPVAFYDPKDEIIPVTYVSKNKEYLRKIIEESPREKMILKPLNAYGGSGVIVIEKSAMQNVNSLLEFYIDKRSGDNSNYVILQEYVEGAEKGDVRILMLNGEPIGAMKRIPAADDIRSNVHAGGRVEKHTLTKREKYICKKIGKKLVDDGLYFVGLDIISEKLIEINVCSPGGITRINRLNRVKLQQNVLDFVEEVVKTKESVASRKKELKKEIEDA